MNRDSLFNPNVTIETPFPRIEEPSLFCWQQAIRSAICDDEVPRELEEWMAERDREPHGNISTWGICNRERIGGYFEAQRFAAYDNFDDTNFMIMARCLVVFKRDLFGFHITHTALNLCLQAIFGDAIETAFFPVFAHNTRLKELFVAVGLRNIGQIAPRLQDGNERDMEMFAVTARGWAASNQKFLAAQAEHAATSESAMVAV